MASPPSQSAVPATKAFVRKLDDARTQHLLELFQELADELKGHIDKRGQVFVWVEVWCVVLLCIQSTLKRCSHPLRSTTKCLFLPRAQETRKLVIALKTELAELKRGGGLARGSSAVNPFLEHDGFMQVRVHALSTSLPL